MEGTLGKRRGILADVRERVRANADTRNLVLIAVGFAGIVASTYAVGYVAWQVFGLSSGAAADLVHSIYDRWDVLNYELIAKYGYGSQRYFVAWFPPSPSVMRVATWVGISPLYTATAVVLLLALGASLLLYLLTRMDYGPEVSRDAAVFLLIYPPALFLFVPYNESFLVFAVVAAFYFARRGMWPLAGLMAGLASGTRVPGLIVGLGVAAEYANSIGWNWRRVRPDAMWLALAPLGLLVYMTYLYFAFDDPLAWYHRFKEIPHAETLPVRSGVIHFIPSLLDDIRTIWITHSTNEFVMNVSGLGGLVFWLAAVAAMVWLRLRPSYIVFSVLIMGPALYYGRLDAFNRYTLPAFPMFIAVAILLQRYRVARLPYMAASLALLYVMGALFAVYYLPG